MPFVKGKSGNPAGKKPGTSSKTTILLREAVLRAAETVGCEMDPTSKDGLITYLCGLAKLQPVAFATLMGKAMPLQVTGGDGESLIPPGGITFVVRKADGADNRD